LNLNVHFHVVVLDGVFSRDADARVRFHPAAPPTPSDLEAIVRRMQRRSMAWVRRHGYADGAARARRTQSGYFRVNVRAANVQALS
jgi:hypothetical protein